MQEKRHLSDGKTGKMDAGTYSERQGEIFSTDLIGGTSYGKRWRGRREVRMLENANCKMKVLCGDRDRWIFCAGLVLEESRMNE